MSSPAAAVRKASQYWRLAGMSYLDALSASTVALRRVVKEPLRSDMLAKQQYKYREFTYTAGKENPPTEVYSDPSMKKN